MGATVQLFNKFQRLIAKTSTGTDGRFAFASLPADLYSVRVSLVSYLPASRDKIAVKPGLDSVLEIHLASLLSSIQVRYTLPTAAMSNDWKWVLRSSPATRAITRFLPEPPSTSQSPQLFTRIFSETHAMVSLSGGDTSLINVDSGQADLGTGFIVSTNILGKNQLQLGGNYAQSSAMGPSAMGLVAIYTRSADGGFGQPPEVTLSVSQLGIVAGPGTASQQGFGESSGVRAMSLSIYETMDPLDNVHLEYGMTGESVNYVQHTSRVSPFARMTVSAGAAGKLIASYSNGGRPDELTAHQAREGSVADDVRGDDLAASANTLSRLPQIVYDDHRLKLERTQNYELGYQKTKGSHTYSVSGFHESVSDGRINVSGNPSVLRPDELLSDGVSKTLIYDIGRYHRSGVIAAARQQVNPGLGVTIAYGRMGGFAADPTGASSDIAHTGFLDKHTYNIATVNLDAKLPKSGTKVLANYGWAENKSLIPTHIFTTQNTSVLPGLNILVRQPLPPMFGMPGHLEITADLRNLLAQGYLPIAGGTADGHNLLALQAPRAVRGGLSFIF